MHNRLSWWHWVVVLFIAVDLIAAGWGLNPGIETEFYSMEPRTSGRVRDALSGRRLYLSALDDDALKYDRFLRFDTFDPGENWRGMRAVLLPNTNMFDGIASLNNFDPLVSGRYSRWMQVLSHAHGDELQKMLDLSGAGVIESLDPTQAEGVGFKTLPDDRGKRVRWVPCAREVGDEEQALQITVGSGFDPEGEVIVEGLEDKALGQCGVADSAGQAAIEREEPNRLAVRVRSDKPGWLLLSDTWYPGWKAFVDGMESPIYRANYVFRAVAIPEGEHEVVFHYQPLSLLTGSLVSIVSLLIFAYICVAAYRRRS